MLLERPDRPIVTRDIQYSDVYRHRYAITLAHCMRSCRAPIASLDCMEEFNGGGGGGGGGGVDSGVHCSNTTGTKEQLLTSCIAAQAQRLQHPSPGIRYRNLGKSGLRVSNVGLGTLNVYFASNLVESHLLWDLWTREYYLSSKEIYCP